MRYAMVIDTVRCVGCEACVVACKIENDVPQGYSRDWVVTEVEGQWPHFRTGIRSQRCNHCERPACAMNCPTGAIHKEPDGTVLVDNRKCTGCKSCIAACPYDVGFINPATKCSDKCTFCAHRVREGKLPACVATCPANAMHFGDLEDPNSQVHRLLATRKWKVLKPEAGTKPNVYYQV
jgi:Fe-S-cluster-containing dehydrogenase component